MKKKTEILFFFSYFNLVIAKNKDINRNFIFAGAYKND